jgi:hypothetical protein
MGKYLTIISSLFLLFSATSCLVKEDPKATHSELLVTRGDIVVTSFTSDSLVVFNADGVFQKVLYQLPNTVGDAIAGISWLEDTNEILLSIDGTPDRVEAFNISTGIVRNFYNNTNFFTGTPLGIAQLKNSGDVLITEGATIERFSANGIRETWTTIWPSSVHANSQQIIGLTSGRWLSCSSTAGLRIFADSTTTFAFTSTATSAIVTTTASYGCAELSDGTIVVAWNGTTDSIQTYTSTLTTPTTIFANSAVLSDPRGIAIGENDEIYVLDTTRNMVVELDTTGNVVREFGNSYLQSPRALIVIPDFN